MSAWTEKHLSEAFSSYDDSLEQKFGFPAVCAQFSSLSSGATIMDYGCGAGALTKHLLRMQTNVVGVDISEFALKMAQNTIRDSRVSFFHPEALPPDIVFDGCASAFLFCTLEGLSDISYVFEKAGKQLKPGAHYVVLDFNMRATGIDFRTFRAGVKGLKYFDSDRLPVTMLMRDGTLFSFNDTYWRKTTLIRCATNSGFFRFCYKRSSDNVLPDSCFDRQAFSLMVFERI